MKVIIDRFEGEFAVVELENKSFVNMPRQLVPEGAGEGAVLLIGIKAEETQERQKRIEDLQNSLWKD